MVRIHESSFNKPIVNYFGRIKTFTNLGKYFTEDSMLSSQAFDARIQSHDLPMKLSLKKLSAAFFVLR